MKKQQFSTENSSHYAKEHQLLVLWTPKGFSLNIVKDENNINIIRGYGNLNAYGYVLFATVDSILDNMLKWI